MLGDDLIRVATLARNRKSCTGVAATKGRHLGFAPGWRFVTFRGAGVTSITLADLLTPLLAANPFSAMRAALWW
jgi:hypothetical protein